jgi:hypothetical protein
VPRKFRFPEAVPVEIQQAVVVENGYGEPVFSGYETVGTINAEIWPLSGSRVSDLPGITEKSTHRLFSSDDFALEQGMYVLKGNKRYLVSYVADAWNTHLDCILEARNDQR